MSSRVLKSELFANLPVPWPHDLLPQIQQAVAASKRKLVVLDDDPTGTQTVHDIPVLTTWDVEELQAEFANSLSCFYLLTNSRSLAADAACALNREIARNLKLAAAATKTEFLVVSRSDSTLRGHFPGEPLALSEVLGDFDAILLIPYFEAGGRFTIHDVHYVAEGEALVPAAETPFARDAVFGYLSSNLRDWVAEKFGGAVKAKSVASISLEDLRTGGPDVVCNRLLQVPFGNICVVNAAGPRDMEVFVSGLIAAESRGRRYLFRTGASFVSSRIGLAPRPLWEPSSATSGSGGLVVVGSHVPKTTAQLNALCADRSIEQLELSVSEILNPDRAPLALAAAVERVGETIAVGRDAVVFTTREVQTGSSPEASLEISRRVSQALVDLVRRLPARPRFLIGKGGITSSDVATRGLGVRRAMILGQLLPGIPVWELGPETKFPGLPYVVFPGNVGDDQALQNAVKKLRSESRLAS